MRQKPDKPQQTSQILVAQLVPGMVLAQDVVSSDGQVLIGTGATISNHTINKLQIWGILTVSIQAELVANPITDPKVAKFVLSYQKSVLVVQQAFENIRANQQVPLATFNTTAGEIADSLREVGDVIDRLYDLPVFDDATFQHSVNVGVIAALIATWLDYPLSVVNAVSLAGLLHDVGKSQLPVSLLHRPDKLPQEDFAHYKKHAQYGFELVRSLPDLADSIKISILQHHERTDGKSYPFGLPPEKIHPYAKIIAIADLYDEALTVYRDPHVVCSPYAGLERLNDMKHSVDPAIRMLFTERQLNYLSGNIVALSDGRQGKVVWLNKEQPTRSMVQLTDGTVINLGKSSIYEFTTSSADCIYAASFLTAFMTSI